MATKQDLSPPSQSDQCFFNILDFALGIHCNYANIFILLVGDFDAQTGKTCLGTFLYQHELQKR